MKTPIVTVCSTAILLFAAAAADGQSRADSSPNSVEATFKSLDRNRDQALSKIEAKADTSLSASFATADVNADGYVSKPEYVAHIERSTASPATREPPTQ